MLAHTVLFWIEKINSGHVNMHNDAQIGRLREVRDDNIVTAVFTVLNDDNRYTIDNIQEQLKEKHCLDVSRVSICQIMKEAEL